MSGRRDSRGASLILVLVVLMILSGLAAGLLELTTQGLTIGQRQVSNQREELSADAAVNLTLQMARSDRSVAAFGTDCPSRTIQVDGIDVIVSCVTLTAIGQVDRAMTFSATVGGRQRVWGGAVFRDSAVPSGDSAIDITSWRTRSS